jgi:hypothetical protein
MTTACFVDADGRSPFYLTIFICSGNRAPPVRGRVVAGPYLEGKGPQPEEVPVSFASEPGRDDGNPPPVNIVIPNDARELDRDVLAYHREQRVRRRRQRLLRLFSPLRRREFGGQAAILPLIATCVALSMLAAAMLSVVAISPASAPTLTGPSAGLTSLPAGTVQLDGRTEPVRSLASSALALVPARCDCGQDLSRLAGQATAAHVGLYFVAAGAAISQLADLTARFGGGTAKAVYDPGGVLAAAYHPVGLTVLLVHSDATAEVRRNLPHDFQLTSALRQLTRLSGHAAR